MSAIVIIVLALLAMTVATGDSPGPGRHFYRSVLLGHCPNMRELRQMSGRRKPAELHFEIKGSEPWDEK